ncbi:MAG: hypothetical protein Q8J65_07905 [Nitrosomonadales bacterium]|nr:hypothetical protein [Nitrosomonadales bacterium]
MAVTKFTIILRDIPEPNPQNLVNAALDYINADHPLGKCVGVTLMLDEVNPSAVRLHCLWQFDFNSTKKGS